MSRGFWICVLGVVLSWAFAVANFVIYFTAGDLLALASGLWCAAMAAWSMTNTVRIGIMDREERGWDR